MVDLNPEPTHAKKQWRFRVVDLWGSELSLTLCQKAEKYGYTDVVLTQPEKNKQRGGECGHIAADVAWNIQQFYEAGDDWFRDADFLNPLYIERLPAIVQWGYNILGIDSNVPKRETRTQARRRQEQLPEPERPTTFDDRYLPWHVWLSDDQIAKLCQSKIPQPRSKREGESWIQYPKTWRLGNECLFPTKRKQMKNALKNGSDFRVIIINTDPEGGERVGGGLHWIVVACDVPEELFQRHVQNEPLSARRLFPGGDTITVDSDSDPDDSEPAHASHGQPETTALDPGTVEDQDRPSLQVPEAQFRSWPCTNAWCGRLFASCESLNLHSLSCAQTSDQQVPMKTSDVPAAVPLAPELPPELAPKAETQTELKDDHETEAQSDSDSEGNWEPALKATDE